MRDKTERLKATAEVAYRLAALKDPVVASWFRTERQRIADAILDAASDDQRRELAASGRAIRDLESFICGALRDGERAERELSERQ